MGPALRAGCLQPSADRARRETALGADGPRKHSGPFERKWAPTFGRYCFVFNYTKFPDFILSYQRHKMPTCSDQKKTQVGSQRGQFQWPGQCCGQFRVPSPPACPSAPLAAGGRAGLWVPAREACARVRSMGLSGGRPVASASSSESPSFCPGPCSAEGRAVSGPGRLWDPAPTGWRAREAPSALAPLPCAVGRRAHCAAGIVKLNFPDVQAPGARACCLERKWGLGKAEPYFLRLTLLLRCRQAQQEL